MIESWSCDFETTTEENDCRVWAWVAINLEKQNLRYYGNDIESFIEWCFWYSRTLYFHNAKFDCSFIIDYLLKNNFKLNKDVKITNNEFTCLVSDKGFFYTMEMMKNDYKVRIVDSLKILPYSVNNIAKGFHLEISKLSIDYKEKREKGHKLTEEEKEYITNDALIVAQGLKIVKESGDNKITAGGNAFADYIKICGGKKNFRKEFPTPDNDEYIRKSYHGGFTYVNPVFQGKELGNGIVLDVNSLYPYVMHSPFLYPYGSGAYYEGKYIEDSEYPLYFQRFKCSFRVRENYLPTIQLKGYFGYNPIEYISESHDIVELTMTNVDLELFLEHYEVDNLHYIDGFKYKAVENAFNEYIDKWYKQKEISKSEGNYALYQLSKLKLNSLYGKMATSPRVGNRWPYLSDNGVVSWEIGKKEEREPVYIPVGSYVTSYARNKTIRAAQKNYDRFIYADTDSLHLIGYELPQGLEIDDYKLGAWKHESSFTRAKFLRSKLYLEEIDGKLNVKGAGMTDAVKENVTFDNFKIGSVYDGKLRQKTVSGGTILLDTTFKILDK